jgi:hypothetical protein
LVLRAIESCDLRRNRAEQRHAPLGDVTPATAPSKASSSPSTIMMDELCATHPVRCAPQPPARVPRRGERGSRRWYRR